MKKKSTAATVTEPVASDPKAMDFAPWEKLTVAQQEAVRVKFVGCDTPGASVVSDFEYHFNKAGEALWRRLKDTIFPSTVMTSGDAGETTEQVIRVSRLAIRPSPLNPRTTFSDDYLNELGLNIRNNSLINALIVRPCASDAKHPLVKYEIVAGECRWRASGERPHPVRAGELMSALETLPVIVRALSDSVVLELMVSENMKRRDLSPLEEMNAFRRMLDQHDAKGVALYSSLTLAEKIGVSLNYVRQRMALSKLTAAGREALADGRISFFTARTICQCPESVIEQVEDEVLHPKKYDKWRDDDEPLTADETQDVIQERYVRDLSKPAFELKDPNLVPVHVAENGDRIDGGACTDCPWNSANQGEAATEAPAKRQRGGSVSRCCLNVSCYNRKIEVNVANCLVKAKEAGAKVLSDKEAEKVFFQHGGLNESSSYVELDSKPSWSDRSRNTEEKKLPTWRKLVKGESTVPVVVAVDKKGHVHELVERKLAIEAVRLNGNERYLSLSGGRGRGMQDEDVKAREKAEREKAKERVKISTAVLESLIAAAEDQGSGIESEILGALRSVALRHAGNAGCLVFCKRRGIERVGNNIYEQVAEIMAGASGTVLWGMVLELLVSQDWSWCHSANATTIFPEHAGPLLDVYKVDVKAVEKRVKDEGKKPAKAKAENKKLKVEKNGTDGASETDEKTAGDHLSENEMADFQAYCLGEYRNGHPVTVGRIRDEFGLGDETALGVFFKFAAGIEDPWLKRTGKPWKENSAAVCPICLHASRDPRQNVVQCHCPEIPPQMPEFYKKAAKKGGKKGGK